QPEKTNTIVLACVHLHNFLRRSESSKNLYCPPDIFDTEDFENQIIKKGTWRSDSSETTSFLPLKKCGRKSAADVEETRERYARYFATTGRVHWQDAFE
ncbi:protein ANTAGONIST OF LIKE HETEROCHROMATIN PROTEIN 1-like, partial [Aphis craccivora]